MAPEGRIKDQRHKSLFKSWCALWPLLLLLALYPVNNTLTRTAFLAVGAGCGLGLLYFCWNRKAIRFAILTASGIILFFLALPARNYDATKLRMNYVRALSGYEGTRYVWGGENRVGIDCSGLVRKALIVADGRQGIVTLNPGLARESLSLWWHDCSAQALGEEYRHRTRRLFSAPSLNSLDYSQIMPGDIAVSANGIHTLAYLGGQTWIEADPSVGRVVKVQAPAENVWFSQPIEILRWTHFD
jgi:hypothetical protein